MTDDRANVSRPSSISDLDMDISCFWKSRRSQREAIQVSLKSYQGNPYLDARVYAADRTGPMTPTPRGVTIGIQMLPQFAKAVGDGLRKAHALGLIRNSS